MKDLIFILIRPQMGENIGAAARVMQNFGLQHLRLVAPRDGWPNPKAEAMATHAEEIIQNTQVFETLQEAIGDCQRVYMTVGRQDMPKAGFEEIHPATYTMHQHIAGGERVALVFGPERAGISNDELALADKGVTIPTGAEHRSLNLAQAVGICAYEYYRTSGDSHEPPTTTPAATRDELHGLVAHLEGALEETRFYKTPEIKPHMQRNLRQMFAKTGWSAQEVQTFRGVIAALIANKPSR